MLELFKFYVIGQMYIMLFYIVSIQISILICKLFLPLKNTGVGCHSLLQGNLSDLRMEPGSPALQTASLPSEPPGMPIIKQIF